MIFKRFLYNGKEKEILYIKEGVRNGKEYIGGSDLSTLDKEEAEKIRSDAPFLQIEVNEKTGIDYIADSRILEKPKPAIFPVQLNYGEYAGKDYMFLSYREFQKEKIDDL